MGVRGTGGFIDVFTINDTLPMPVSIVFLLICPYHFQCQREILVGLGHGFDKSYVII